MQSDIIGFTCGAFDLFHAGHNVFLRDCRKYCDQLIVGLQTNPNLDRIEKNRPVQSIFERYTQLQNCIWVNKIIPYDTEKDLLNLLACSNIQMRFLGDDYLNKNFTGKSLCEELDIKIVYIPRKHNFSSTELRDRIKNA